MPIYFGRQKVSYQQKTGGGEIIPVPTPSTGKKTVNFYDYEGTLLHSYTRDEALALTELPALPDRTSENLTCQGWNWTLADIQNELTKREDLDYLAVGTNYITTDGATHINITFDDKYRNVMPLMFKGNVTIDWGDGVTESVNHTTATAITHEYAIAQSYPVKYTIKLTVNSGTLTFGGDSNSYNICGSITQSTSNPTKTYSSRIDSVFTGNGVTNISVYAFAGCYSLASITIPSGVTNIDIGAFRGCYSLTSISIPNSVTSIGNMAFYDCYSITSITIPDGVTSIGMSAFQSCSSLTSVTIPDSVTRIGDYAFQYCYSFTSITIPSSVTSIGSNAFQECYSLTSITIPSSVTSIGNNTFRDCYALASVTIPDGVTSIGIQTFYNCYSLTSISIPNDVSSINERIFYNCYSLASVTIPNGVTSIGSFAFRYCYGIIKYDFSTHTAVPTLSKTDAFTGIAVDAKIVVPDALYDSWITATNWATYVNYIVKASEYREPGDPPIHTIITYTDGNTTEVEVGDDGVLTCVMTKGTGNQTTANITIQSVEIGRDVTSIEDGAFARCMELTSVTIPSSVTSIGQNAFRESFSLTSVTIPSSVTSIGSYAFYSCSSLNDITIDKTMEEVSSMTSYPWAIPSGKVIKCTDGDITVS